MSACLMICRVFVLCRAMLSFRLRQHSITSQTQHQYRRLDRSHIATSISQPCGLLKENGIDAGLQIQTKPVQSKDTIEAELQVLDVTLHRCLSGGYFAETWSAFGAEGKSYAVKILKMGVVKGFDLNYAGETVDAHNEIKKECAFAQEAKKRIPSIIPNCLSFGSFSLSSEKEMHFAISELALGRDLEALMKETPTELFQNVLPTLSHVTRLLLKLYDATVALFDGDLKLFHADLSLGNVLIAQGNSSSPLVHIVDFGKVVVYGGGLKFQDEILAFQEGSQCHGVPPTVEELRKNLADKARIAAARTCRNALRKGISDTAKFLSLDFLLLICSQDEKSMLEHLRTDKRNFEGAREVAVELMKYVREQYRGSESVEHLEEAIASAVHAFLTRDKHENWDTFAAFGQALRQLSASLDQ